MMTIGETHTPEITFRDSAKALYAPTSVTVTVRAPNGTLSNPAVTNPSLGVYQTTFTLSQIGVWRFEFQGTGPSGAIVREGGGVCAEADVAA